MAKRDMNRIDPSLWAAVAGLALGGLLSVAVATLVYWDALW